MDTSSPMRCALYLRVSTKGQAKGVKLGIGSTVDLSSLTVDDLDDREKKVSLPTQEESCRAYAKEMGWEVLDDYIYVEAHTGFELWDRDVLTQLREDMSKGVFDVILVHSLERLARDQDHQGLLFSEAKKHGIIIDSATETVDDTPLGKFMRAGLGLAGEIERVRFRDRSLRGRKGRVDKGEMPVMAYRIFGYDWGDEKKKTLVRNNEEAHWVEYIFNEAIAGTSLRQIAQTLKANNVKSTRNKCTWGAEQVRQILSNEIYKGEVYAYKYETVEMRNGKKKTIRKPKEEWVRVNYTPPILIDPVTWELAQRTKGESFKSKAIHTDKPFLLDGPKQAVCGTCGAQMARIMHQSVRYLKDGTKVTDVYPIYKHNVSASDRYGCSKFSLQAKSVDEAVLTYISLVAEHPEKYIEELSQSAKKDPTLRNRESAQAHLKNITEEHKALAESFGLTAHQLDAVTRDVMVQNLSAKAKEIERWRAEVDRLEEEHRLWQRNTAATDQMIKVLRRFSKQVIDAFTLEGKRALVEVFGVQVRMYPQGKWEGSLRIPFEPEGVEFSRDGVSRLTEMSAATERTSRSNRESEVVLGSSSNRSSTGRFLLLSFDRETLESMRILAEAA